MKRSMLAPCLCGVEARRQQRCAFAHGTVELKHVLVRGEGDFARDVLTANHKSTQRVDKRAYTREFSV